MALEELKSKLKKKYYKFDEQAEVYSDYSNSLTIEEKYGLIEGFLDGRDFWGYFQLITKILYELAENSKKYVFLLEKISNKIKGDLASGPFFTILINIGKEKPGIGLDLYENIMKTAKDNNLKITAGLIFGGYSKKNNKVLEKNMEADIKYPEANSMLKAILVKYENEELPKQVYNYLEKISKSENKEILTEFANLCLVFYKKNKTYFYGKIKDLIKLKDKNISYFIFDRLSFQDILNQDEVFELISQSIDLDEIIVDKLVEVLRKYPSEYQQISDWLIYWLNKGMQFKLKHFDWVLEELAKSNNLFIKYFIENYKKVGGKNYRFIFPHIFEIISKHNSEYALQKIFEFESEKKEPLLFYELCGIIIGNIYQDTNSKDTLIKLVDKLIDITKTKNFISFNEAKYIERKNKDEFLRIDYDFIIDFSNNLLEQLRTRKDSYNFNLIRRNIKKYSNINFYAEEVLNKSEENKRYTPLLWLGENEEPKLDDIKINEGESDLNKAIKMDFARGRFWPRVYLKELNKDLEIINKKPNQKFEDKKGLIKNIKNNFSDEKNFWSYLSELIFINKFEEKLIDVLEPSVPNRPENNLDLKINLFGKDIYFEVTSPKLDRNLKLANRAVVLGNKSFSVIDKKFGQLFSKQTLNEIKEGKRNDLFLVVIDISNSIIDEHQLLNSFLGSLSLTMVFDKKTGRMVHEYPNRQKDSLQDKNQNTEVISGAVYLKRELIFTNGEPVIKLKGDIIVNPNAKNKLSDEEVNELRKIIFS